MRPLTCFLTTAIAFAITNSARAQLVPRPLALVPEAQFRLGRMNQARDALVAVGKNGELIATSRASYLGEILAFDSTGKALGWKVLTGRRDEAEIMFPGRLGWINGTSTLWVDDPGYKDVALVDGAGKVLKSIEYVSWVHPSWAERRKYPVFASMEALAMYPDHSMLVVPGRERSLIDTPGYDHTTRHLLRVSESGAIQASVATLPLDERGFALRVAGCSRAVGTPFAAFTEWSVANDGMRIVIATPVATSRDSGTFRVTSLSDRGDTIYTRTYPQPAVRNSATSIDNYLNGLQACGSVTAEQLRDKALKQIPAFKSFVTGVVAGIDGAAAVIMRAASDTVRFRPVLVLDARGEIVGSTEILLNQAVAAVSRDHIWITEPGKNRDAAVVRYRLDAKGVQQPRTGPASASSKPSHPPA